MHLFEFLMIPPELSQNFWNSFLLREKPLTSLANYQPCISYPKILSRKPDLYSLFLQKTDIT